MSSSVASSGSFLISSTASVLALLTEIERNRVAVLRKSGLCRAGRSGRGGRVAHETDTNETRIQAKTG